MSAMMPGQHRLRPEQQSSGSSLSVEAERQK